MPRYRFFKRPDGFLQKISNVKAFFVKILNYIALATWSAVAQFLTIWPAGNTTKPARIEPPIFACPSISDDFRPCMGLQAGLEKIQPPGAE